MSQPKPTILVIEDDAEVRDELCELIESAGFEVLAAANGQDGLSALRKHPHTRAVVLDLVMPVMNGATFRGEQLRDPAIAAIPTILLTGRNDVAPMGAALEACAWLPKPFAPDALLAILARYRPA